MSPVQPLPGWSAAQLIFRGANLEICAAGCVLLIAVEGMMPFPWYYWGIPLLVLCFLLLAIGGTWTFHGYAKSRREVATGYSTVPQVAHQRPELTYLDRRTFTVISGPGEPRPRSGRRRDIEDHLRQQQV